MILELLLAIAAIALISIISYKVGAATYRYYQKAKRGKA